jgi:sarcosine oxidase
MAAHVPQVRLQGDEAIGFEPTGGIVMCERAIATQLQLASAAGAVTVVNTAVTSVAPRTDSVRVETANDRYIADKVIVATGAWFPELAPAVDAAAVSVTRQVVFWFEVDDAATFGADRFPFVMWPGETIADYSAVFPIDPHGRAGLKILGEQFHTTTTPQAVDRRVSDSEVADFYGRLVAPRLDGVRPSVVHRAVCLYTNTIDDHFLIDFHPASDRILLASPCSGHGFKHSTALGEAMVAAVAGSPGLDLSPFVRH